MRRAGRILSGAAIASALSLAYMAFEAQWVRCRQIELPVPGLPVSWSGLTVLHLSDIHAGVFAANERSLSKVVRWAETQDPDLVLLTGDILGDPERSTACLKLLTRIRPKYGTFAVTGNHEYGLSKTPLAHPRNTAYPWARAGIMLLSDDCIPLPVREGARLILCGADYMSGGFGLLSSSKTYTTVSRNDGAGQGQGRVSVVDFPILLIHEPPPDDSPLAEMFPLAFAGHTHGGQLRIPTLSGLAPLHLDGDKHIEGVHAWGNGLLVVSRGIGTSLVPLRLLTRPEATLWRLVYTSP